MKKLKRLFIVLLVVAIAAFITNPSKEDHKNAVKIKLGEVMKESMGNATNDLEKLGQDIGMVFGGALKDQLVESMLITDNYFVFSVSKVRWMGEEKLVSVGAFRYVFVSNKVKKVFKEGMN